MDSKFDGPGDVYTFEELKEELGDWFLEEIRDEEGIPFEFLTDIAEEMMSRPLTKEEIVELTLIYG